ncbi:MAG: DNA primase [Cyclobacteriaceae bacterium]|jgi:DNA primase
MINQVTIDEIKNQMDILDVVGDYVTLKKSGSSYKALSPFTAEKTPSFYVVPSKGIFKDFSSGKGGDSITFLMEVDGMSYTEALRHLANKYGIEIKEEQLTDQDLEQQNRKESLYIVLNFAAEYFAHLLAEHEEGRSIGGSYFQERGFNDEVIAEFKLGYSLNIWDHLYQEGKTQGHSELLLEEAGLIVKKDEGKVYDRFRGRVIFPIHNISGKVIAFGARILTNDKKQPKYLNSPETELYNKSKVLYGMYQAKQAIRKAENCYLVEGYTDVISLHQIGVQNVVSSSGTALTPDQARLLKRYTKQVTILFDGDSAGIRASFRGIDILLEEGLNVKAVPLPVGEDPDSHAKALGTSAFAHFLENSAVDFIRFKTQILLEDVKDDPIKKAGVIHDIIDSIIKVQDAIQRSLYVKECSNLLDISEAVLIVELNKQLKKELSANKPRLEVREIQSLEDQLIPVSDEQIESLDIQQIIAHQEQESIRVLINYGDLQIESDKQQYSVTAYFLRELEGIHFTHPIYQKILGIIQERAKEGQLTDAEYLLSLDDKEMSSKVIDLVTQKHEVSPIWTSKYDIIIPMERDQLREVSLSNILRLKFRIIQHQIELEHHKLKKASAEEVDDILDEIQGLKQIEVDIAKFLGNVTTK